MLEQKYLVKPLDESCLNAVIRLVSDEYLAEQSNVRALYDKDYSTEIETGIKALLRDGKAVVAYEHDVPVGFLGMFVSDRDTKGYTIAWGPIHDYGIKRNSDRGTIASLLFQHLSELLLPLNVRHYMLNIYAHDREVLDSFVLNQFCIMSKDAIKDIEVTFTEQKIDGITFHEFSVTDIQKHKKRLLNLWKALSNHLQKSPTYYYGDEFTDDAYWEHICDENTRLFIARDEFQRIIGIVDTCRDDFSFIWSDAETWNVGDLYVEPRYRGKGVAQGLLQYTSDALKEDGIRRLWVMHGTGNPNALRFWNKYFTVFVYQLTRSIDERIIDLHREQ